MYERTAAAIDTPIATIPIPTATASLRTRNVARNRLGRVVMSPSAVTMGVETESRSHSSR